MNLFKRLLPSPRTSFTDSSLRPWRRSCALLVVPYAAVLHHALFFPRTCMWVPFEVDSDRESDLSRLLREDGSLPWAVVAASATYRLGKRHPVIRRLCASLFTSTLPLSVWIWDVPFSRRVLCEHLHDGKISLGGHEVRTAHIYVSSAFLYAALLTLRTWRGGAAPTTVEQGEAA